MAAKPTAKAVEELLERFDRQRATHNPNVHPCQGADFHSPRPLLTHGYRLTDGSNFWLCATCKDNIDTYLHLWDKLGGLEWEVQRCFGNKVRIIADRIITSRKKG